MIQEFIDQQNVGTVFYGNKLKKKDIENKKRFEENVKKIISNIIKDNTKRNLLISKYFDNKNINDVFSSKGWIRSKYPSNSIIRFMMNSGKYETNMDIAVDILLFENMVKEANELKESARNTKNEDKRIEDIKEIQLKIDEIAEILSPSATETLIGILESYERALEKQ